MLEQEVMAQSRKRPLEIDIQNNPIHRMRTLVKELRPHFIEVLKTPDFRNCKSAEEIRQGMKLFGELCKQMTSECVRLEKCSNMPSETDRHNPKPNVSSPSAEFSDGTTFTVGNSAIGWNFIIYRGGEAVYYGRTKEAFRALNPKSTE